MKSCYLNIILLLCFAQLGCNKPKDEIESLEIDFMPSFLNVSSLKIDRKLNTVNFAVGTKNQYKYDRPKLSTSLKNFEDSTDIKVFYKTKYLKSNSLDSRKIPNQDGISLVIYYSLNTKKDTIHTGNILSNEFKQNLFRQIVFLRNQTNNVETRDYLESLSRYFD